MSARSYLYVPGDQPNLLAKAAEREADALILDLEDSVRPSRKPVAREMVADWLRSLDRHTTMPEIWLRVNSPRELMDADIVALEGLDALTGLVIPKADNLAQLERLDQSARPGIKFQLLIETARGLMELERLSAGPRVELLQLGEADLLSDLRIAPGGADTYLDPVRLQVVIASAAAGLSPPVAPVFTDFKDLDAFIRSSFHLGRMGFGSRAVIHPAQVTITNQVFSPSPDDVERARRLLQASRRHAADGQGVFTDDEGNMIDEAILRWARDVLSRATDQP